MEPDLTAGVLGTDTGRTVIAGLTCHITDWDILTGSPVGSLATIRGIWIPASMTTGIATQRMATTIPDTPIATLDMLQCRLHRPTRAGTVLDRRNRRSWGRRAPIVRFISDR